MSNSSNHCQVSSISRLCRSLFQARAAPRLRGAAGLRRPECGVLSSSGGTTWPSTGHHGGHQGGEHLQDGAQAGRPGQGEGRLAGVGGHFRDLVPEAQTFGQGGSKNRCGLTFGQQAG